MMPYLVAIMSECLPTNPCGDNGLTCEESLRLKYNELIIEVNFLKAQINLIREEALKSVNDPNGFVTSGKSLKGETINF